MPCRDSEKRKEANRKKSLSYYYKNRERILKERRSEKWRNYYKEHGKKARLKLKNTAIQYTSTNIIRGIKKHPLPENNQCPVCGCTHRMLNYHHVDDNNTLKGIWLCCYCHMRYHKDLNGNGKFEYTEKINYLLEAI